MNQTFERDRGPGMQSESGSAQDESSTRGGATGKSNKGKPRISAADMKRVLEAGRRIGNDAVGYTRRRPQLAIGVALGAGFVAGSIFGSRLGQVMMAGAAGYLIKHALLGDPALDQMRRTLERMVGGGWSGEWKESHEGKEGYGEGGAQSAGT
jgi:hypothetical protein